MIHQKAFIFDMDGTLVNNMQFQYEAWRSFFFSYSVEMTIEEVKKRTSGGTPQQVLADFFEANLIDEEIPDHLDRKEAIFQDLYGQNFAPVKGLIEFLNRAAQINIPAALATGSDYRNINYTLDKLNVRQHFKGIVSADNIQTGKPDPEFFLLTAEKLKVTPRNCFVFEDSFSGIEAAHRAGMKVITLTTTHSKAVLENLPRVLIVADDYNAAEPADLFVDNSWYFIHS